MISSRRSFALGLRGPLGLLAALAVAAPSVHAGEAPWPTQTIRIVVAQAPGDPPDLVARFVAEPLRQGLATPVVIENRAGAGGIVGVDSVARAPADGYTLLLATLSTHALGPHANGNARYDPVRDFNPVANLFRSIKALWVPSALPVSSLSEFVRYALMPNVPTATEQGFDHLNLDAWMGLVAPAGTPASVVQKIHAELDAMLQSPQTIRWARDQGLEIARVSSAAFGRTIEADYERWGEVIRTMGLRQR